MPVETPDNVIERDPKIDKKSDPKLPWFNWWSLPTGMMIGPLVVMSFNNADKACDGKPYPSKDAAETAAADNIADHNANCSCGADLADYYIGAYESGKSPE